MSAPAVETQPLVALLAFNASNQLAVRRVGTELDLAFVRGDVAASTDRLETAFPQHTPVAEYFSATAGDERYRVYFTQVAGRPADAEIVFHSLDSLAAHSGVLTPGLAALLGQLDPYLVEIPYLHLGENDFIYKFRPAQERNTAIYAQDASAGALYQSQLCVAIKAIARQHERSAAAPV
ncbi:MAG: ispH, partial [Verrucomicrobia bacterium]|nr:ispH [Verrucomicrobiota bacterium]